MGGAERVGEAGAHRQLEARQAGDEIGDELSFAAVKVGDTGDVDPQAIVAVDIAIGPIAPAPAGEAQQRGVVTARVGRLRGEARQGGARIGEGLTDAHAFTRRPHVDGGDADAVCARLGEGERYVIGRQ